MFQQEFRIQKIEHNKHRVYNDRRNKSNTNTTDCCDKFSIKKVTRNIHLIVIIKSKGRHHRHANYACDRVNHILISRFEAFLSHLDN